jgi:UTP-glucose-1-phosphate uridylyltransferase
MAVSLKVNNWLFVTDQTPRLLLNTFETSFLIRRRGEREEVTQLNELQNWQKNETKSYVKSQWYTGLPDGVFSNQKSHFG